MRTVRKGEIIDVEIHRITRDEASLAARRIIVDISQIMISTTLEIN